jgi:PKHD-type hydroxylase
MLIFIESILTQDEVGQFRDSLSKAEWRDGAATAGTLARFAKRNLQLADDSELAASLGNRIQHKLAAHPLFISAALPRKIFPPKFNCYQEGGAYETHVDSALMHVPSANVTVRTDISATLFLSEPRDYDGGELQIEDATGTHPVKLAAGSLVLYPSSSLHRVTPVTRGTRLAAFFWVESFVRDDIERALLFDLDQTIQAVTRVMSSNDPNLLRLTGVYHNLVRRWAAT